MMPKPLTDGSGRGGRKRLALAEAIRLGKDVLHRHPNQAMSSDEVMCIMEDEGWRRSRYVATSHFIRLLAADKDVHREVERPNSQRGAQGRVLMTCVCERCDPTH